MKISQGSVGAANPFPFAPQLWIRLTVVPVFKLYLLTYLLTYLLVYMTLLRVSIGTRCCLKPIRSSSLLPLAPILTSALGISETVQPAS